MDIATYQTEAASADPVAGEDEKAKLTRLPGLAGRIGSRTPEHVCPRAQLLAAHGGRRFLEAAYFPHRPAHRSSATRGHCPQQERTRELLNE